MFTRVIKTNIFLLLVTIIVYSCKDTQEKQVIYDWDNMNYLVKTSNLYRYFSFFYFKNEHFPRNIEELKKSLSKEDLQMFKKQAIDPFHKDSLVNFVPIFQHKDSVYPYAYIVTSSDDKQKVIYLKSPDEITTLRKKYNAMCQDSFTSAKPVIYDYFDKFKVVNIGGLFKPRFIIRSSRFINRKYDIMMYFDVDKEKIKFTDNKRFTYELNDSITVVGTFYNDKVETELKKRLKSGIKTKIRGTKYNTKLDTIELRFVVIHLEDSQIPKHFIDETGNQKLSPIVKICENRTE